MSMDWKANERRSEAPQGDKTRISPALIIWLVIVVLAVIFIVQNARNAQVKFLFWDGTMSLWIVLLLTLLAGVLLDRVVTWALRRRKDKQHEV
jgi:uncharacterized integral membrane protein